MHESDQHDSSDKSDGRRSDLIRATLCLISAHGVPAATARAIAAEAGVTQGLIRHYFNSKDELLAATFEKHMTDLVRQTAEASSDENRSAKERLVRFVTASLSPPIASPESVSLWAGFFQLLLRDRGLRETHVRTYHLLRQHIAELIKLVYAEERRSVSEAEVNRLSIICNGLLDGLWLEQSAVSDSFEEDELLSAGLVGIERILDLDLRTAQGEFS